MANKIDTMMIPKRIAHAALMEFLNTNGTFLRATVNYRDYLLKWGRDGGALIFEVEYKDGQQTIFMSADAQDDLALIVTRAILSHSLDGYEGRMIVEQRHPKGLYTYVFETKRKRDKILLTLRAPGLPTITFIAKNVQD